MAIQSLYTQLTLMGTVIEIGMTPDRMGQFVILCRNGEKITVIAEAETQALTLQNLDGAQRDRVPDPPDFHSGDPVQFIRKYIRMGRLLVVEGVYQTDLDSSRFLARTVHLLHDNHGRYLFEGTHWWLTQIQELADVWLGYLFGRSREYDFSQYRTNIGISGVPHPSDIQECATLSRLIYGLSSAYMLTGNDRYLDAARAGVTYQEEHFKSPTEDGRGLLWVSALQNQKRIMTSCNSDDHATVPLYEQIYALAGLAQYYRVTLDPNVLDDIRRTIHSFQTLFRDEKAGGYFSHLDFATMKCTSPALGDNSARKNWNSIGDHLPAYLINLILALDPRPKGLEDDQTKQFVETLWKILKETSDLIITRFVEQSEANGDLFVTERFLRDWTPDTSWRWQKDRVVLGHNLKISWNLARVAVALHARGEEDEANHYLKAASRLAKRTFDVGIDGLRGGLFDVIEKQNKKPEKPHFTWWTTKDFWQQEQAILAFLILEGLSGDIKTKELETEQTNHLSTNHKGQLSTKQTSRLPAERSGEERGPWLQLARETMAFWNLFFLDRDRRGVFFRVTENGLPYAIGGYQDKGGHSISGYHVFELGFLAHIYLSTYVRESGAFSLKFRPCKTAKQRSINVLPDFLPASSLQISSVLVNGQKKSDADIDSHDFRVNFHESELGCEFIVKFVRKMQEET